MSSLTDSPRQIVILVALIAAAIAGFFLFSSSSSTQPAADAGQKVIEDFLEKIRSGHPDQAWEATTAEFKSAQGRESFVRSIKPLEFLQQPLVFFAVNTVTIADQPRSEYIFRAPDGKADTNTRIVIGRENGEWKVDMWILPTKK